MQKTRIEWCDYTINPVKGLCPVACPYCYARRIYERFKWNPEIRFEDESFLGLAELDMNSCFTKTPARVFVGSTIDLFHDSIPDGWLKTIFEYVRLYNHNIYIFLTKRPENLIKWSPFPLNCHIGVSVTKKVELHSAIYGLTDIQCSKRFLCFEPLLEPVLAQILPAEWDDAIDQVIIGQQTPVKQSTMPKIEWIVELVKAADRAKIPVFLKNNLEFLIHHEWQDNVYAKLLRMPSGKLRQEYPKGSKRDD